ncbi:MAG TPA: ferritin-like domain-containing protein [Acidobacteriota bacterium]|jgi:rubrerythrin|nr:ferritin-like domain-containing protein [Acidobacteriota bacterium]HNT18303.1 ferritin-like domain-containing protein [Acidobacteriota bacterium]HPA27597.1 ferritin-like domain-containing protein [Acidobacteriota bacterium]HQO20088.1 ferritin-like domain-containing protein [Acidobacteriota bacterium]HQQ47327.1 ferritin-like domain-containing protein [Acidobacteriota bacterium]
MSPIRQMTDDEKKLFTIFQKAVEAEQSAQAMYREAMALCSDPKMREILQGFYNDEARHEKEILAKYRKLKEEFGIE